MSEAQKMDFIQDALLFLIGALKDRSQRVQEEEKKHSVHLSFFLIRNVDQTRILKLACNALLAVIEDGRDEDVLLLLQEDTASQFCWLIEHGDDETKRHSLTSIRIFFEFLNHNQAVQVLESTNVVRILTELLDGEQEVQTAVLIETLQFFSAIAESEHV